MRQGFNLVARSVYNAAFLFVVELEILAYFDCAFAVFTCAFLILKFCCSESYIFEGGN